MSGEAKEPASKTVLGAAADWLVLRDTAPLSEKEQAEFEGWLAEDPVHRAAYEEVARAWDEFDEVGAATLQVETGARSTVVAFSGAGVTARRPRLTVLRRAVMGAVAASILVFAIAGADIRMRFQADAMTAIGETSTVSLSDGSIVVLNSNSAIAVNYEADERRIRLLRGEAQFDVVSNPSRPFRVVAGDGVSTALGTVFLVRRRAEGAQITVLEGRVSVVYGMDGRMADEAVLTAKQQIRYAAGRGLGSVATVDPRVASAWRRGKMIFEDRSLDEVIEELNRYHVGTIRILDGALGKMKVNGVFDTSDPIAAVEALDESLSLETTRMSDYLILLHR